MFTGIIEEVGTVKHMTTGGISGQIAIKASKVLEGTQIGDSIAVNGICLTVVTMQPDGFTADVMAKLCGAAASGAAGAATGSIWSAPWLRADGSAAILFRDTLTAQEPCSHCPAKKMQSG